MACMEASQVTVQKIMKHRLIAAAIQLFEQVIKVSLFLRLRKAVRHVEDSKPAFIVRRRNNEVVVRRHHDGQEVGHMCQVQSLLFQCDVIAGDQGLQDAFGLAVSRCNGFIRKKEQAVFQMPIEVAGQVRSVGDRIAVLAK